MHFEEHNTMESPKRNCYSVSLLLTLFFWSSKYDRDDEKDQELRCDQKSSPFRDRRARGERKEMIEGPSSKSTAGSMPLD